MTHLQCLEMLPWYETLDDERRREFDEHVGVCPECIGELDALHALQETMAPLAEIPEPSPYMLHRTLARIDAYEQRKADRPVGWRRVTAWWFESAVPIRLLVAAQAVLIVLLGWGAFHYYHQATDFVVAGGPVATGDGPLLTVAFQPGVSEEALRQALWEVKGTIVNGPSALGIYIVQIPRESDASQVSARLGANSSVVRFAERTPDR